MMFGKERRLLQIQIQTIMFRVIVRDIRGLNGCTMARYRSMLMAINVKTLAATERMATKLLTLQYTSPNGQSPLSM